MKNRVQKLIIALAIFAGIHQLNAAVTFTDTPSAISNTYSGIVTLQISGISAGDTVLVQKFLDTDSNSVIDSSAILWQQFQLTDGQASVFTNGSTSVTNFNVPGDTDGSANGSITANLYPSFDFAQVVVGKYFFVLSSPVGHFSPITNSFVVTNFPFAQTINGNVLSNTTPVPNAVVILFQPSGNGENPVGGVVANGSGAYSIKVPTGSYLLWGSKTNFLADLNTSPSVTLGAGATITTNVVLTNATQSISGSVVDANNPSLGLAGYLLPVQANDGFLSIAFTGTNGNFTARVVPDQWKVGQNQQSLAYKGYLTLENNTKVDTTTGSVSGVTISLPKATAIFYGTVKDNLGNPLPGVAIASSDNDGSYYEDGYSFTNGNYVSMALGGLSNDPWQVQYDQEGPANYIYAQPSIDQNGGTNLNVGQAVKVNITGILATNYITGNVQFDGTNVVGVQVYAYANIGGNSYQSQVDTDNNGNYSLNVANGNWNVNVYDCGCSDNDSLNNVIDGGTYQGDYQDPGSTNVTVNSNNSTNNNFVIQSCTGIQILTTSPLPNGTNGDYYSIQFNASSCNGNFNWSVNDPADLPPGFTMNSDGAFFGTPGASGTFDFTVQVNDDSGFNTNEIFSLYIAPSSAPLQITTPTGLNNGTNGAFYTQTIQATGGTPPYGWYIPGYSASPPANLTLSASGVLSGTLSTTAQTYYFYIDVTDSVADYQEELFSLNVANPPLAPLLITNTSLPNGNVGAAYSAQLGATGGQPPYYWQLAAGSASLPTDLSLNSTGLISGTPVTNKVSTFKVQVTDSSVSDLPTNKVLSITINPLPSLRSPAKLSGTQFQFLLNGASNQNYTIQISTNLTSATWTPLYVTNNATTNSFIIVDPNATNKGRFYRAMVGP